MPTYDVPKAIRDYVKAAIDYNRSLPTSRRAAMKRLDNGDIVEGTGHKTAKKLINNNVDEKQLILMRAWFARHGDNPLEIEARKKKNSKAAIAYALWGGNRARVWVNRTLKEIENDKKNK
jgi:hypothetical protein